MNLKRIRIGDERGDAPKTVSLVGVVLVGGDSGSVVTANRWILDLSGYHQMAAAPAVAVNWSANAVMIAIASGPADFGVAVFDRRDVKHE